MNAFDYRQSPFERVAGIAPANLWGTGARVPLLVIALLVLTIGAAWSLETQRIAALDRDLSALQGRAHSAAPAATRAEHLIAHLARARAIGARIADAHRAALVSTNALARLGNALPSQTWLTSVQTTPAGTWTIAGRSTHVAEIGTTLQTIAHIDALARTRLVSVSATGRSGHVLDFVVVWERAS